MPATSASAPGKAILFGEHAVVYNRPAIAVPVTEVKAHAYVQALPLAAPSSIYIEAPDIQLSTPLVNLAANHPFALLISALKEHLQIDHLPAFKLKLTSTIPIASGLGSGAAVSVAAAKAISTFLGFSLPPDQISEIAYEVEKYHHGTPSGIDNTVIAHGKPIYFVRSNPIQILQVAQPFSLLIADSGIPSLTKDAVALVRTQWQANTACFESWFDQIADLAENARLILEKGNPNDLGPLMTQNHTLLQKLGVSHPRLDHLVDTALAAGALGAKLAGAGCGGNMIVLAPSDQIDSITLALKNAGAPSVFISHISKAHSGEEGFGC